MLIKSLFPFSSFVCYLRTSKDRKLVDLVPKKKFKKRTTISFARWLFSVKQKKLVEPFLDVHHINGNKKEDRVKNLELVHYKEHRKKHKGRAFLLLICPICSVLFERPKNQTKFGCKLKSVSTCSYSCRDIFLSLSLEERKERELQQKIIKEFKKA